MMEEFRSFLKNSLSEREAADLRVLSDLEAAFCRKYEERTAAVVQASSDLRTSLRQRKSVEADLRKAKEERKASERKLMSIQKKHDRLIDKSDQELETLKRCLVDLDAKTAKYDSAVLNLQKYMGLKIGKTAESAESRYIALNGIDEADPSRNFYIQFRQVDGRCQLEQTRPSIGDLSDFQAALLADGDMGRCIGRIRAKFVLDVKERLKRKKRVLGSQTESSGKSSSENREPNIMTN